MDQEINNLNEIYKQIKSSFEELRKQVNKKEEEMLIEVEGILEERSKLREDVRSVQGKLKTALSEAKMLMDKGCTQGCLDFDLMIEKVEELKEVIISDAEITKMKVMGGGKYQVTSMNEIYKALNELKIAQSTISEKHSALPIDSKILQNDDQKEMLTKWIAEVYPKDKQKISFELLYRGTRDGMGANSFHNKCDNKSPTVIIGKSSKGNVFGGYNSISWTGSNLWKADNKAFIFSITHKTIHDKQLLPKYTIYDSTDHGPIFGNGHDICLSKEYGYNSLGNFTYELPQEVNKDTYFAGEHYFNLVEIEVFAVKNILISISF